MADIVWAFLWFCGGAFFGYSRPEFVKGWVRKVKGMLHRDEVTPHASTQTPPFRSPEAPMPAAAPAPKDEGFKS